VEPFCAVRGFIFEEGKTPWPRRPPSRSSSCRQPTPVFFYVTKKNSRTFTDKMVKTKYDPIAKKHVEFKEAKIK
jgi:ribosomal protein L33